MATPKIVTRLKNQLRSRGIKGAENVAVGKLRSYGILKKNSMELTKKGKLRNSLTPAQRAINRAAKKSGKSIYQFKYDPKTNRATLKK